MAEPYLDLSKIPGVAEYGLLSKEFWNRKEREKADLEKYKKKLLVEDEISAGRDARTAKLQRERDTLLRDLDISKLDPETAAKIKLIQEQIKAQDLADAAQFNRRGGQFQVNDLRRKDEIGAATHGMDKSTAEQIAIAKQIEASTKAGQQGVQTAAELGANLAKNKATAAESEWEAANAGAKYRVPVALGLNESASRERIADKLYKNRLDVIDEKNDALNPNNFLSGGAGLPKGRLPRAAVGALPDKGVKPTQDVPFQDPPGAKEALDTLRKIIGVDTGVAKF